MDIGQEDRPQMKTRILVSTNNYQDIEIKYRDLCFSRKKIIAILLAYMTICSTLIVLHQTKMHISQFNRGQLARLFGVSSACFSK